jgi:hypothetical protein
MFLTKNGLGHILGYFLHKLVWSPWRQVTCTHVHIQQVRTARCNKDNVTCTIKCSVVIFKKFRKSFNFIFVECFSYTFVRTNATLINGTSIFLFFVSNYICRNVGASVHGGSNKLDVKVKHMYIIHDCEIKFWLNLHTAQMG